LCALRIRRCCCCGGVEALVADKKHVLAETKRLGNELLQSSAYKSNALLLLSMLVASCSSSTCAPTSATAVWSLTEALHCLQAFFVPFIHSGKFPAASKKKAAENVLKGGWIVGQKGTEEDGKNDSLEAIYRSWVWINTLNSALLWCGMWMAMRSSLLSGYYHELAIKLENEFLDFRNKCVVPLLSLLLSLVLLSQMAALHSVMELVKNEVLNKFNNKLYFKLCSTLVSSPPSHFC
jgi:hypothetical protein